MASQRSEANSVATSALLQEQNPGVAPGQYTRASLNVGYTTMGSRYPGGANNLGVGGVLGLTEISARMQRLLATENPVKHGPLSSRLLTREHGWPMNLIFSLLTFLLLFCWTPQGSQWSCCSSLCLPRRAEFQRTSCRRVSCTCLHFPLRDISPI